MVRCGGWVSCYRETILLDEAEDDDDVAAVTALADEGSMSVWVVVVAATSPAREL